jgi:hypothetical protein
MRLARTAILRLYDYMSSQITLDFTSPTPHILGCNGTLRQTVAWIVATDPDHLDAWLAWLHAMCIDCDCALLLQLNTMAADNGGMEGINMRRCTSCNALLALYQIARTAPVSDTELVTWAAEAQVPAYVVTLSGPRSPNTALIRKVYPSTTAFQLTDRQFFISVLRQIELEHHCRHPARRKKRTL